MVALWSMLLKQNGGTHTNSLPSINGITNFDIEEVNFIERHQLPNWDYAGSFLEKQLEEINAKQHTNYKFVNSVLISGEYLKKLYEERRQKITELVWSVKSRKFEYDEDDTTTWVDNFIPIDWEGEKVYFSYETTEGELLFGLHSSLKSLQKEIELNGALCLIYVA
jgi:hypothetical protein